MQRRQSHMTLPGRLNKNSGSLYAQPTRLKAINGDEFGNFQDGATSITAKDLVAGLTYIWQADKRTLPHPKTSLNDHQLGQTPKYYPVTRNNFRDECYKSYSQKILSLDLNATQKKKNDNTILGNPNKTPSALIQFTLLIHLTVILLTYFDCAAPIVGQYVGTL